MYSFQVATDFNLPLQYCAPKFIGELGLHWVLQLYISVDGNHLVSWAGAHESKGIGLRRRAGVTIMNNHYENLVRLRLARPSLLHAPFSPWLVWEQGEVSASACALQSHPWQYIPFSGAFWIWRFPAIIVLLIRKKKKFWKSCHSFSLSLDPLLTFHPLILIDFNIKMVYIRRNIVACWSCLKVYVSNTVELSGKLMVYLCSCVRMLLTPPYSFYFQAIIVYISAKPRKW